MRKVLLLTLLLFSCQAFSLDKAVKQAMLACHNHLWFKVTEFENLPNAAISVYPNMVGEDQTIVAWIVNWQSPTVKAAGICTVKDGKVVDMERFGCSK